MRWCGAIIVGILLAMFLSALEQTIVAPALPTIGRVLADVENLSFVVTAYLLAATAVTPLFGKFADIHGRRVAMLVAVAIFIVGSVACALAPTMGTLVAARALQGIGGGGILPIAQTIIADMLAPRERPLYQSYSAVMFMAASVLGPVLGGLLTDYLHWSLIFWINVPMGLVALVMTDRALRRLPRYERPHRLDLLGAGLMVAAALVLMLALAWGGRRFAWTSPADPRNDRRLGAAVGRVRAAARARARAVHPARHAGRPGGARDRGHRVLRHRHRDRADHHDAALSRPGARRERQRVEPRADRLRGRHHGRLGDRRPAAGAVRALQVGAGDRPRHRGRGDRCRSRSIRPASRSPACARCSPSPAPASARCIR